MNLSVEKNGMPNRIEHPKHGRTRIIGWEELRYKVPYVRQHILRLEKAGLFPQRVQLGPHRVGWVEAEVDEWLAARMAARKPFKPSGASGAAIT